MVKRLAFEFVIVVIGVLTAFGVQTFSESRSDNERKNKYLEVVMQEINTNVSNIDDQMVKRTQQVDHTLQMLQLLRRRQKDTDAIKLHLASFYEILEISCKFGSYEALKNSSVFDKIDNINLITRLNNLDTQIQAVRSWQTRITDISFDMFIAKNGGATSLSDYTPSYEIVFTPAYIEKVDYLMSMRQALSDDFLQLKTEMQEVQRMIRVELHY